MGRSGTLGRMKRTPPGWYTSIDCPGGGADVDVTTVIPCGDREAVGCERCDRLLFPEPGKTWAVPAHQVLVFVEAARLRSI